jgi:hypothetical protein
MVFFELIVFAFSVILFAGMLFMLELGRRYGIRKQLIDPAGFEKGVGAVEGAVFGLLGLMIAFTFSGAASRFEDRRHMITAEANAIGTAYLRIDLLSAEAQIEMRDLFIKYLDLRIDTYSHGGDTATAYKAYNSTVLIQNEIWKFACRSCQDSAAATDACKLLLPSLNEMIDITTTRLMSTRQHPPSIIFILMGVLCLLGALLAGYGMSGNKVRNLLHMIVFSAVMSLTIYVILDLEYPRLGFIRVNDADQVLIDLRNSMK